MKQSEAIAKTKELIKGTTYNYIHTQIDCIDYNNNIKTECHIYVGDIDGGIRKQGRTFKECLFLLECELNGENEEDQDDGN